MPTFMQLAFGLALKSLFLLGSYAAAIAQPIVGFDGELTVIGAHLEGRLDENPDSGYNRVLQYIVPQDVAGLVYHRYPLVRALRNFVDIDNSCFFPSSAYAVHLLTGMDAGRLTQSIPIDRVTAHLFVRHEKDVPAKEPQIQGKRVVVQRGAITGQLKSILTGASILRAPNDLAGLKMLQAGRVDFAYSFMPDALIISEINGLSLPHFNPEQIFFETTVHLVCKNFGGSERIIEFANEKIRQAKQSGDLQKMLGRFARIVND